MFAQRFALAGLAGVLLLFLASCAPVPTVPPTAPVSPQPTPADLTTPAPQDSPLATPTETAAAVEVTPAAGKGALTGRLIDLATNAPLARQSLSLPSVICPSGVSEEEKRDKCVFGVDEAFDPSTLTDDSGIFVFKDLTPGEYVMLVGNPATKYTILSNDEKLPLVWKAEADKVINVGDLVVDFR